MTGDRYCLDCNTYIWDMNHICNFKPLKHKSGCEHCCNCSCHRWEVGDYSPYPYSTTASDRTATTMGDTTHYYATYYG